ncbi:MAG: GntR family transcriptional regulator [Clostridia bacterium]|nr:GntR family transcriptional regulator [Clostridia bacterium]
MDFKPTAPIWLQVANEIKSDIASGALRPGEKLQSSRDLAVRYAINPNTAARVYQELEREGVCETRRGLGTFVTQDADHITALRIAMAQEAITACLTAMRTLGFTKEEAIHMLMIEEEHSNA